MYTCLILWDNVSTDKQGKSFIISCFFFLSNTINSKGFYPSKQKFTSHHYKFEYISDYHADGNF